MTNLDKIIEYLHYHQGETAMGVCGTTMFRMRSGNAAKRQELAIQMRSKE